MVDTFKVIRDKNKKASYVNISLDEVVSYLRKNPEMVNKEVNPYSVDKLMMLLDNEKLAALEEEFNEHPNGIELPNFVLLMKSAIVHPDEERFRLISGLIKLFQEIDINGDGHMEWSEFTQYIIDAVIGEKDTKFFDARFEKDRELTENEILDKAYSRKTKRYVLSKLVDNSLHGNLIRRMNYCSFNDLVLVLEQNARKLKLYNPNDCSVKYCIEPTFEEKSFILDCCYSENLNMIGAVMSDRRLIVWENNPSKREVVNKKIDVLQTGIWYLSNHKCWITTGSDHTLNTHVIGNSMDRKDSAFDGLSFSSHKKKITEVTEIFFPKFVASCSLDGTIKLWDLTDKIKPLVSELKDNSTIRGIRGITYSYDYGGNLLSFGFETHINVWCPEVSKTKSYIGRLEGHSNTIVACKFIPGSPNCVSVDDKGNIRIWDIRTLSTIQLIAAENQNLNVTELEIVPKHDKFILGGKRMFFFDNSAISKSVKNFNEDVYPIYADYNHYFRAFVILTKIDIRVYDVMNGRLKKVFTDLGGDQAVSDLSSFAFGGKQRKFYLGNNSGAVKLYNMKNGESIHRINNAHEEQELDKSKTVKRRENNEISQLIYVSDEKLLITSSWDSTIRIYDESEPDESMLLRIMSGAHKDSDIIVMDYSSHLNLLASGSANGMIAIWDFESGKLESICLGHTADITTLKFADPFPILISGSADGTICVWPVRPHYLHQNNVNNCILKIVNSDWKEDGTEQRIGINSMFLDCSHQEGVSRGPIHGNFPTNKEYHEYVKSIVEPKPEVQSTLRLLHYKSNKTNASEANDKEKAIVGDEARAVVSGLLDDNFYCPLHKPPTNEYYESIEDFNKYRDHAELEIAQKKNRCIVYFGDQKGFANVIDLTHFLKRREINPCKSQKRSDSYQLRRKEWVDVSKSVEAALMSTEKLKKPIYCVHTFNTILLKRWEAHSQGINHMSRIADPPSFMTCSPDKHVKIWSPDGEVLGDLNLVKLGGQQWDFPFDWIKHKLKDIDDVFAVMRVIEKEETEKLGKEDKDRIKLKYLMNSFGNTEQDFLNIYLNIEDPSIAERRRNLAPPTDYEVVHKRRPSFLEPNNRYKEMNFMAPERKEPEPEKYNFSLTNYKDSELAYKVLKHLEDHDNKDRRDKDLQTQGSKKVNKGSMDSRNKFSRTMMQGMGDHFKGMSNRGTLRSSGSKSSFVNRLADSIQQSKNPSKLYSHMKGSMDAGYSPDEHSKSKSDEEEESPAMTSRPLFSNFSAKNLKRNTSYATTLVKNYDKTNFRKTTFGEDLKYLPGDAVRSLKLATRTQISKFESESQNIYGVDKTALTQRAQYYKNLRSKHDSGLGHSGGMGVNANLNPANYKIIANRLFMENPTKNDHKILKSNNRLYVL